MGARSSLRMIVEGMLAGFPFDLGSSGDLKLIPVRDNAHTLQLGDGSHSLAFKVFLGGTNKFFHLTSGASPQLILSNVSFSFTDVNTGTLVTNTMDVAGATTVGGDLLVDTNATIDGTVTGGSFLLAEAYTFPNLTVGNATVVGNTVAAHIDSEVVVILDNTDVTGAVEVTGNATTTGNLLTNTFSITTPFELMGLSTGNTTVTGATNTDELNASDSIEVSGNTLITGVMNVSNNTVITGDISVDSLADITTTNPLAAMNDVGSLNTTVLGNTIANTLAVDGSLTVNADLILTAGSINTETLIVTGNTGVGELSFSGTATLSDAVFTGGATSDAATVLPPSDDGDLTSFGNASFAADLKIFLGGANVFGLFDRGSSRLQLSTVTLNTNAALIATTLDTTGTLTGSTSVNTTGDLAITGGFGFTGNSYVPKEYLHLAANAFLTAADAAKVVTNRDAAGAISVTLPNPSDVANTVAYEILASADQDITIDTLGTRSATFTAGNKEYLGTSTPPVTNYPASIEAWFRMPAAQVTYLGVIGNASNNVYFALRPLTGTSIQAVSQQLTNASGAGYAGGYADNAWHHAAAVFNNASHRALYFDGVLRSTDLSTINLTVPPNRYTVGAFRLPGPSAFMTGGICKTAIYNTALSNAQYQYLWNSGAGRSFRYLKDNSGDAANPYNNMRASYEMTESSGNRIDQKNSFDLTDFNTVTSSAVGHVGKPGWGTKLARVGDSSDAKYTINTQFGHGRLLQGPSQWVFLPYGGTTFVVGGVG